MAEGPLKPGDRRNRRDGLSLVPKMSPLLFAESHRGCGRERLRLVRRSSIHLLTRVGNNRLVG